MGLADTFSGYNWKNSYTLFLLTVAYIFGEIAHYLIGSLSKEMARDIGYGDYACYNKPGTNNSTVKCSALKSNQRYDMPRKKNMFTKYSWPYYVKTVRLRQ